VHKLTSIKWHRKNVDFWPFGPITTTAATLFAVMLICRAFYCMVLQTMKIKYFRKSVLSVVATAIILHGNHSFGMGGGGGGSESDCTLTISNTQALQFGGLYPNTGGTVTVSTSGTRTAGGSVVLAGGTVTEALFDVNSSGDCGSMCSCSSIDFSISLPSSATISSGGDDITVDTFVSNPSGSSSTSSNYRELNIGATLNPASSQAAGSYSGTFAVTIDHN